ncbi:MAG: metallophosphoesterase family protein [DPANN group archaeon]|nr:metallophosphoesterase family protein [DPANN group archaeon]
MRILCTSDFHEEEKLATAVLNIIEKKKIDVFIGAGDFHTDTFTAKFLKRIKIKGFVVSGNWDYVTFTNKYISSIDWGIEAHGGYHFFCVGNHFPLDFAKVADKMTKDIDPKKLIFVTHYPPYGILDRLWNGRSVGYPEFLDFIRLKKPTLHVFGHIHEDTGIENEKEKGTTCINCALASSRKAYIVEMPGKKIEEVDLNDFM